MDLELSDSVSIPEDIPNGPSLVAIMSEVPDGRRLVVHAMREAMQATKYYYDAGARKMVHTPDYKVRLEAAKAWASYTDGIPAKTLNVNSLDVKASLVASDADIEEQLKRSPALREHFKAVLANMEPKRVKSAAK